MIIQTKNQAPNKNKITQVITNNHMYASWDVYPEYELAKNPHVLPDHLSKDSHRVLLLLMSMAHSCIDKGVFPGYEWMADHLDCSKKTVQRTIRYLEDLGLLNVFRTPWRSNVYRLSNWFRIPLVVNTLQEYLPSIRVFSLAVLLTPGPTTAVNPQLAANVLHIKELNQNILINRDTLLQAYISSQYSMFWVGDRPPNKDKFLDKNIKKKKDKDKTLKQDNQGYVYKSNSHQVHSKTNTATQTDSLVVGLTRKMKVSNSEGNAQMNCGSVTYDEESQVRYSDQNVPGNSMQNRKTSYGKYSIYSPVVIEKPRKLDPVDESAKLAAWTNTEEYKKAASLFGDELLLKVCNKIVTQACEDY